MKANYTSYFYLTRWNKSSSHNIPYIYIYSIMRHKFWGNCIESIRNFHRKWLENGGKSPEKYIYRNISSLSSYRSTKNFWIPLDPNRKNEYLDTNFLPKFFTFSINTFSVRRPPSRPWHDPLYHNLIFPQDFFPCKKECSLLSPYKYFVLHYYLG